LRKPESFPLGGPKSPSAADTGNNLSDADLRIARIAYRRGKGEDISDEGPLSAADEAKIARYRPARDDEHFRRWQDQHASPETIVKFEEVRRQWHERNDPKK
jgi:hypothetical protein